MAFLARRAILLDSGQVPFAVIPPGIQGIVAVRTEPSIQVNTAEAQAAPQYYDIIDGGITSYPGYILVYVAVMNTDGNALELYNVLPTGIFPHGWAGWPQAIGP
jgi:hypothetical protein